MEATWPPKGRTYRRRGPANVRSCLRERRSAKVCSGIGEGTSV